MRLWIRHKKTRQRWMKMNWAAKEIEKLLNCIIYATKWMCIGRSETLMRFPRFPSSALGSPFVLADFFQKQCRHIAFSHDGLDFRRIDFAFVQSRWFCAIISSKSRSRSSMSIILSRRNVQRDDELGTLRRESQRSGFKSRKFNFINCTAFWEKTATKLH